MSIAEKITYDPDVGLFIESNEHDGAGRDTR